MLDSYYRDYYQKIFVNPFLPIASLYSPSTITFLGLLSGILIAPLLAMHWNMSALIMLLLSGWFDTLDGSVARHKNETSAWGAVFDIAADRVVEFSVILGLYFYQTDERALYCLFMLGSILICVTSFLVIGIFTLNTKEKGFYYSPGMMERGEAFIFFFLMILAPVYFHLLSSLFSILVALTAIVRLWRFRLL